MSNDFQRHPTRFVNIAWMIVWLTAIFATATWTNASAADEVDPPPVMREFRAAWVATVANIDWPSRSDLSTDQQQAEMIDLLDQAAALHLNAIILQVRPSCDALYASELEPWSEYLTGQMGRAPEPFYDPLEFAVAEAHARGLELHAWFNPYRALHAEAQGEASDDHISKTNPDVVKQYGKYLWLDPGEPAAVQQTVDVVMDVVERYDIDGVHLDDYFYPYPITEEVPDDDPTSAALDVSTDSPSPNPSPADGGGGTVKQTRKVPFPDDPSWERAQQQGEPLGDRDDWRRHNVDRLVERLYRGIKQRKPWVKFGVSPFGVGRPGKPPQIKGFDQYTEIYADAQKWFVEGWVDYFTPQLYWAIDPPKQSYPALLGWWHRQNKHQRHLWPGNFTSRLGETGKRHWEADEVIAQIWVTRAQAGANGNVHFSMKALTKNWEGIADALVAGPYREPALVPATLWLADEKSSPPEAPRVTAWRKSGQWGVTMQSRGKTPPWLWVVRVRYGDGWTTDILPGTQTSIELPSRFDDQGTSLLPDGVSISSVDRVGREGAAERKPIGASEQ